MKNVQADVKLNVAELPTVKCECGNVTFHASFILKKVSALISPSGKETTAPIQVFSCVKCNKLMPMADDAKRQVMGDIETE